MPLRETKSVLKQVCVTTIACLLSIFSLRFKLSLRSVLTDVMICHVKHILVYCFYGFSYVYCYEIPQPKVKLMSNSFRVAIPDELGIRNVAFNVNKNRLFESFTQGEYSGQARSAINGSWYYEFKHELTPNDVIHVWLNVQYKQSVYRNITQPIRVCTLPPLHCEGNEVTQTESYTEEPMRSYSCEPSITEVLSRNICKGELIFEDNFDSFNRTVWSHEVRAPLDTSDAEFLIYDTEARVENGLLKIKPLLWSTYSPNTDCRNGYLDLSGRCTATYDRSKECYLATGGQRILPPVVAPRINTKDFFSFKYGRIEVRAKLPQGDWLAPLILLEPLTKHYGQIGYESGQMRVAFIRGNEDLQLSNHKIIDGRILYGGAILSLNADTRDEFMANLRHNSHFGKDFHVYSLTWTSDHLVLSVDNQIYGHIPGGFSDAATAEPALLSAWKRGSYMAPFDRPFYIGLGLTVGGFGDYPDAVIANKSSKPWLNKHPKAQYHFWQNQLNWYATWDASEFLVDYVRVYAI